MGKNDWRKKQEEAGGKTISVTLTPEAATALEELQRRLKKPDQSKAPSQAEVISRVLVWGLKEVEAGKKGSNDKGTTIQEDATRVAQEQGLPASVEERLAEIESRLARVETGMLFGAENHTAI
ncbi:hypothetical protein [Desulfovibrio sp. TomC]|uniref:hypothetical protein n=1 Tax=Desulfovibrio sp. TomC TaxID=1562888 RepID=UPI000574DF84|nr:hypothetical protein [Desulfovibrio sp. TomC]KHK03928.1 hypothetical protein NY78_0370 [Desulfovibrio sp. TomC]